MAIFNIYSSSINGLEVSKSFIGSSSVLFLTNSSNIWLISSLLINSSNMKNDFALLESELKKIGIDFKHWEKL